MSNSVQILDSSGKPFEPKRSRASMLVGGGHTPYDAADIWGSHMAEWQPYLWSPDGELNVYRDRIVSRIRDVVRNDGWASAAVTRTIDNVIGADFRPVAKPDWIALRSMTGIKGFDHVWADEFARAVEANYRAWAYDPGRYCDTQRNLTVPQMMALAFRHKCVDGDALGMMHWRPQRIGVGKARYATVLQIIDPDRLSNPQLRFDQQTMRGGVEVDEDGAAVAYWIRRAHQGDWFSAEKSLHWDRILRETDWGRPIIVHDFDHDRAAQHRGGAGMLAPVLQRLKMLIKYDGTELDAAIINAIFAAYIESPFDDQLVAESLDDGEHLMTYQNHRREFHEERKLSIGNSRMPHLFPGEKIATVAPARPNGNFAEFESAMLRNIAAGTGTSAQMISQNWADVNYSSYRAAMLEVWKTFHRRRTNFAMGFGQPVWCAFLEESMSVDDVPLPAGAPDFMECRVAYSRARWMGPGRGYVDPVKEKQGAIMGMDAGLSNLDKESAELTGDDWRETVSQRAVERQFFKELGMPIPEALSGGDASQSKTPPEAE
ncbi:phage portal protein [Burkholderia pseudomallei]|uniref:phage portal protein n=1 Tax=Burkholderia pseudomallei TaxID=28450 RepID=UPI000A1A1C1C|nr:phage portal protein [Burkholderia pseudomallei]ARK42642.1 phage portal protein [Burkholderia pseudomallei]ARK86051.1 phage portal protein [Burkholderia pseudomallei]ARL91013.1 phage portal protein [Burkholderia pseudomallei]